MRDVLWNMNEWTVVTVIVALVGLIVTVATPMIKLNSTITALSTQVKQLLENLEEFKTRYKEQLKDLNDTDQRLFGRINDHETRISKVETHLELLPKEGNHYED